MLHDALGLLFILGSIAPWVGILLAEVRACRKYEEPYALIPLNLWDTYEMGLYYWTAATIGFMLLALLFLSVE